MGTKVDWDFRISDPVKNPRCLTPESNFGEFQRDQLAKSTLLTSLLVPLGSFQMGCGKQRESTTPIKSLVILQPWFLSLRWKNCLWQNCSLGLSACSEGPAFGQNTHDDDDDIQFKNILFSLCIARMSGLTMSSHGIFLADCTSY